MPPWICSNQRERERDSPTRYSRDALDSRNNTLVLILTEKPLGLLEKHQEKRKGDIATMPENILAGTGPSEPANQGQGQPNNVPLGGDSYTTMGGPSAGSNDVSPTSSPPSLLLFSWWHEICFIFGSIFFVLTIVFCTKCRAMSSVCDRCTVTFGASQQTHNATTRNLADTAFKRC